MTVEEARKMVKSCSDRKKEIKQCMRDILDGANIAVPEVCGVYTLLDLSSKIPEEFKRIVMTTYFAEYYEITGKSEFLQELYGYKL